MQLSSSIIERNRQEFDNCRRLLVVNPPAQDSLSVLSPACIVTHDYRVANSLKAEQKDALNFGLALQTDETYDAALLFMPKSKGELKLLLAFTQAQLDKSSVIYLVGEKKQGIASGAKVLATIGEKTYKIDSAKHCQLWCTQLPEQEQESGFDLQDWLEYYTTTIAGKDYTFASIPGVFSFERLDEGSAMLIECMEAVAAKNLRGRTLDFGCGSGPIGVLAKSLKPEIALEMVDINWLALQCAQRSCELNGVEATIYASDGWSDIEGRFDTVLTNPPFHSGVATEYETTERFIRDAYDHMNRYAPLFLVANAFLKYGSVIEARFGRCDLINENTRFKVYKTSR